MKTFQIYIAWPLIYGVHVYFFPETIKKKKKIRAFLERRRTREAARDVRHRGGGRFGEHRPHRPPRRLPEGGGRRGVHGGRRAAAPALQLGGHRSLPDANAGEMRRA